MRGRSPKPGPGQIEAIEDLIAGALLAAVGVVAAFSLVALAGAELASLLSGNSFFRAGLGDSISALAALPHHLTEPEGASPEPVRYRLPGPVLYWLATTAVVAALATIALVGARGWTGHRRRRGGFGPGEPKRISMTSSILMQNYGVIPDARSAIRNLGDQRRAGCPWVPGSMLRIAPE